jgi:hypothetical protein
MAFWLKAKVLLSGPINSRETWNLPAFKKQDFFKRFDFNKRVLKPRDGV